MAYGGLGGWFGVAGPDLVGCEGLEKKAKVDQNEEIGGDTEVGCYWYNLMWEFSWRGCTCKLVLHDDKTTIASTWK